MKMHVEKSITINKPASEIYNIIADLGRWESWSPWRHMEPTSKIVLTGAAGQVGQSQSWNGEVTGSGKMTLSNLEKNKSVTIDLEFITPWKSRSVVNFKLQETGSATSVIWKMDGQIPWFMFFLCNMMQAFVGADFQRGLLLLKDDAESGIAPSRSEFLDVQNQEAFQVVGLRAACNIAEISSLMQEKFARVGKDLQSGLLSRPQRMGSLDHKFDIPKGVCEFTAGLFYKTGEDVKVPEGYERLNYPAHKALRVDHYGAYRHLSNPWAMVSGYLRARKFKSRKDIPMYDVYVTMPDGRPEKEIYTQLFAPIK